MNMKSILLGTAAGLMVASAAQAADLPGEPTPAAVDYVKVCDAFGTGFFYIPGTETCLKFDARVRVQAGTGIQYASSDNVLRLNTDARFGVDARSATELGTLRTYVRVTTATIHDDFSGNDSASARFDRAFIQLGYLTVGVAANFYDSFGGLAGSAIAGRNWGGDDYTQVTLLADNLGGGFYAGIQAHATAPALYRQEYDADDKKGAQDFPDVEAIIGIADQPWGSAALAAWYSDQPGDDFFSVKGGVSFKATDALTVNAVATYLDNVDLAGWNTDAIMIGLGAEYAVSDAVSVYGLGQYSFNDIDGGPDADSWGVTLGATYTIVSGLVATAEVAYDDGENNIVADNDFSGVLRLTREW